MSIVGSGVSVHMTGVSSLTPQERENIRQLSSALDIQTTNTVLRSTAKAKVDIQELGAHPLPQVGGKFFFGVVAGKAMR